MTTFTNTAMKPGQNVFANVEKPDQTLTISAERTTVTRNSVSQPLVRSSVVLQTPERVAPEGCTDGCGPHAQFTRLVRIETSAIAPSKAALIADLKLAVQLLDDIDDKLFEGFIPPASSDIVITVA